MQLISAPPAFCGLRVISAFIITVKDARKKEYEYGNEGKRNSCIFMVLFKLTLILRYLLGSMHVSRTVSSNFQLFKNKT